MSVEGRPGNTRVAVATIAITLGVLVEATNPPNKLSNKTLSPNGIISLELKVNLFHHNPIGFGSRFFRRSRAVAFVILS
jgi:hypothetical protein